MATITTTAFKTDLVDTVSGTTFNSQNTPFASGDVGRCIVMTDGSAEGQIRKIVSFTDTSTVEVDYDWDISPLRDEINAQTGVAFEESLPANGDTWLMSTNLDDLDDGTVLTRENATQYTLEATHTLRIAADTFLYDNSISLYGNFGFIDLVDGAYARFGDIDENGYVKAGCQFVDLNDNFSPRRSWTNSTAQDAGDFHMYGGTVICPTEGPNSFTALLWTFNTDDNSVVRMINVQTYGFFGARVRGTESVLRDIYCEGNTAHQYSLCHPINMGLLKNLTVNNCRQAAYWRPPDATADIELEGVSVRDLNTALVHVANTSTAAPLRRFYFNGFEASEIEVLPAFTTFSASSSDNREVYLANFIETTVVDADLLPVTDSYIRVIWDFDGSVQDETTVTDGTWDPERILWALSLAASSSGSTDKTLDDEAVSFFGLYRQGIISYLFEPNLLPVTGRSPSNVTFTALPDTNVTEQTKATVDAYTELTTGARLYDRSKAWSVDNFGDAFPTYGGKLVEASGALLDFRDKDVEIDATTSPALVVDTTVTNRDTITQINNWTAGSTLTVAAGSHRAAFVTTSYELVGGSTVTGVTLGGVNMTLVVQRNRRDGEQGVSLWVLREEGIAAMVGSAIVVTYSDAPTESNIIHGAFSGIDQVRSVYNFVDQAFNDQRALTRDVETQENGQAVVLTLRDNTNAQTFNASTTARANTGTLYTHNVADRVVATSDSTETIGTAGAQSLTTALVAFSLNPRTGLISIDGGSAIAATGFSTLKTAGTVTVQDTTSIDGWTIDSDLVLNDALDLTNVTVTGDLTIDNGASNVTLDFSNVTVTGDILNNGTGTLTINASNGSSLSTTEPGAAAGQVNILNSVTLSVTATDAVTGATIEDARVYIEADTGGPLTAGDQILNELTNASGVASTSAFNFSSDQPIIGRIRKGSASPLYKNFGFTGTITSSGFVLSAGLISDE